MTILLINDNPVVSRLLSLCTRDDDMVLEKVSSIDEASAARYDVLFADEASCQGDIASLSTRLDVGKKIYLSYSDDPMAGFDETVKKPFLPSQIIEILNTVEVRELEDEVLIEETSMDVPEIEELSDNDEVPSIFPLSAEEIDEEELNEEAEEELSEEVEEELNKEVEEELNEEKGMSLEVLDRGEIERIKALLDMGEDEVEELDLNEEAYESRKIEVIKEQLIADGLEIIEEEEIIDEVSRSKEKKEKSQKQLDKKQKLKRTEKKKKKKSKNKKFTEGELSAIEDAVKEMIKNLKPKEVKKLLKGKEIDVKIHLEDKK